MGLLFLPVRRVPAKNLRGLGIIAHSLASITKETAGVKCGVAWQDLPDGKPGQKG